MDIDSFSQCLSFMQTTNPSKALVDKALPLAGALFGTTLGFALNYASSKIKDNKSTKNKLMCINEDIEVIEHALNESAKECARLLTLLIQKSPLVGNRLPGSISGLCIDSYFIDVAHKYSRNQRYWIQLTLERLKEINIKLGNNSSQSTTYEKSVEIINLLSITIETARLCKMSQLDSRIDHYEMLSHLKSLETPNEYIAACELALNNVTSENSSLGL
jgi:hypothetical protein